jgi:tRNA-specific 2-thiouridylase
MFQQQNKKKVYPERSRRVFVGMSGGVDSSVSAALLKKQGYDVTGVFIKVWHPDWLPCEWKEERRDAMRVAAALDIPFITLDCEEEYKKSVADYMIEEYRQGRTPNPDIMCNKEVKFGSFLRKAREMGADFIATGHYAQISTDGILMEGVDKNKDQSYFLWTINKQDLKHILFPIGAYEKDKVRELARKFKLPTAEKKDSQGICFLGKIDMKDFLQHYIPLRKGTVLDEKGNSIGTHEGALFYTIGQRHGFTITKKTPTDTPYYIISKDIEKNILVVSEKHSEDDLKNVHEVWLSQVNLLKKPEHKISARIRYRQPHQNIEIKEVSEISAHIKFIEGQEGVSVGQSLVFYDGELCIGGGIIESAIK